jgi:hypothetical protein
MGNHCEYGFNEQQQEKNRVRDLIDLCSHKLGNWRWDGRSCVEASKAEIQKQREGRATRYGD